MKQILLVLTIGLILSGCTFPQLIQDTRSEPTSTIEEESFSPPPKLELPQFKEISKPIIPTTWKKETLQNGYSFFYPQSWFVFKSENLVTQFQNWDPAKVDNPAVGLSNDDAKWDVFYTLKPFSDLQSVLSENLAPAYEEEPQPEIKSIEKFVSSEKIEIYLITVQTYNFMTDKKQPYLIALFIQPDGQYFTWSGLYFTEKNAEFLKNIALSVRKTAPN
jgi:hypothetical protein